MRSALFLIVSLAFVPAIAFAAAQSPSSTDENDAKDYRIINTEIDAWAGGTVTKAGDGELVISGSNMPYLTAHAKMRQEMHQKLSGVDDPQQRLQIIRQVKAAWSDKLEAALNQKRAEPSTLTFKAPSDAKDLVILDAKSVRELPFFQKMQGAKEGMQKRGLDQQDLAQLYEHRQQRMAARAERRAERPVSVSVEEKRKAAAEKISEKAKERVEAAREKLAGERLSVSDLKAGDKVLVGYDASGNVAYTIIQNDSGK